MNPQYLSKGSPAIRRCPDLPMTPSCSLHCTRDGGRAAIHGRLPCMRGLPRTVVNGNWSAAVARGAQIAQICAYHERHCKPSGLRQIGGTVPRQWGGRITDCDGLVERRSTLPITGVWSPCLCAWRWCAEHPVLGFRHVDRFGLDYIRRGCIKDPVRQVSGCSRNIRAPVWLGAYTTDLVVLPRQRARLLHHGILRRRPS